MNGKKKVLVVDDDLDILEVVKWMLEDEGFAVQIASNGELLLNGNRQQYDLLLLDITMSGWDGRELCIQLKHQPETKHLPVILFSAHTDIARMAGEAGADGFLAKPFRKYQLIELIQKHI